MGARLDWDLGQQHDPEFGPEPRSATTPRPPFRVTPTLVLIYIAAIGIAGWFGFNLGRWSVNTSDQLNSIENQLDLEGLAWRQADVALFSATLDPNANEAWRNRLLGEFRRFAPLDVYEVKLLERQTSDDGTVEVVVRVTTSQGSQKQLRRYGLVSGAWMRQPGQGGLD